MKKMILSRPVLILGICLVSSVSVPGQQNKLVFREQSTEVKMPEEKPVVQENYLNTVTTTDANGTKYKLVIIGDLLPRFFINNKRINTSELRKYSDIIDRLTPVLWQRQKEARMENE